MNISYNWLKQYINTNLSPVEMAKILTDTGLEAEGVEKTEAVKGGLEGVVIGKVLTKEKHPDADRLNVTTVDVGNGESLNIVCGAPNVEAGQKVVVATVGTTLYPTGNEDGFKIKKAKIRGVESVGMICAEDELGLGTDHDGIMVLDPSAEVGKPAAEFFQLEDDYMIEIGLTPNRTDGMSHIGVARDLLAYLKFHDNDTQDLQWPDVSAFAKDNNAYPVSVDVRDSDGCPRYVGVTLTEAKVGPSPEWLQNNLRSIGLSPINNVVDVTNFVLHEMGTPLHAFDGNVAGDKVIVRRAKKGEKFTTLDGEIRELHEGDLMIANASDSMCIAGVFGGEKSGVTEETSKIFLESAWFDPVSIRKTAKRHGLNTDASFRYERGVDPELTITALKRAALLIREITGAKISSEIIEVGGQAKQPYEVTFSPSRCNTLIGKELSTDDMKRIFSSLDIEVKNEDADQWQLSVAPYRMDVTREADVVEEVLRIYGYNQVEVSSKVNATFSLHDRKAEDKVRTRISSLLMANGWNEMMNNSLTSSAEFTEEEQKRAIYMLNPLSEELNAMRVNMLYTGLKAIEYNLNRQQDRLKLYEFGNVYEVGENGYDQQSRLTLFTTGLKNGERWNTEKGDVDYYGIKGELLKIANKLGVEITMVNEASDKFGYGQSVQLNGKQIGTIGSVHPKVLRQFDIDREVFYAELDWGRLVRANRKSTVKFTPIPKFPEVRRDLSLLLDKSVTFESIRQAAMKIEKKLLKEVDLFDVYEGKNLPEGKKSYAVRFIIQDEEKTLKDKQIDKVMSKIQSTLEQELGASLRG